MKKVIIGAALAAVALSAGGLAFAAGPAWANTGSTGVYVPSAAIPTVSCHGWCAAKLPPAKIDVSQLELACFPALSTRSILTAIVDDFKSSPPPSPLNYQTCQVQVQGKAVAVGGRSVFSVTGYETKSGGDLTTESAGQTCTWVAKNDAEQGKYRKCCQTRELGAGVRCCTRAEGQT